MDSAIAGLGNSYFIYGFPQDIILLYIISAACATYHIISYQRILLLIVFANVLGLYNMTVWTFCDDVDVLCAC